MGDTTPFKIKPASCIRRTFSSIYKRDMSPVLEEFTTILKTDDSLNNFDTIQNKIYRIDFLTGCNLNSNNNIDKLKGLLVLDDILVKGPQYNASKYIDNLSEKRIKDYSGTDKDMVKTHRQFRLNLLYVRFALLCNIYLLFISKNTSITTVEIDSVDPKEGWKYVKIKKNKDTTIEYIKATIEAIKDTRTALELKPETIDTIKNVSRIEEFDSRIKEFDSRIKEFDEFLTSTFENDLTIKPTTQSTGETQTPTTKPTTQNTGETQIPTTNQQDMYQQFVNPIALTSDRARRDNSQQSKSRTPTPPPVNQNVKQSQDLYEKQIINTQIARLEEDHEKIKDDPNANDLITANRSLYDKLNERLSKIKTGGNKRKTKKRSKNITKNKRKTKNTPLKIINRKRRFKCNVTYK